MGNGKGKGKGKGACAWDGTAGIGYVYALRAPETKHKTWPERRLSAFNYRAHKRGRRAHPRGHGGGLYLAVVLLHRGCAARADLAQAGRSGGIDYAVLLVLERTALARMGAVGAAA